MYGVGIEACLRGVTRQRQAEQYGDVGQRFSGRQPLGIHRDGGRGRRARASDLSEEQVGNTRLCLGRKPWALRAENTLSLFPITDGATAA
jgi:hypothetical protein